MLLEGMIQCVGDLTANGGEIPVIVLKKNRTGSHLQRMKLSICHNAGIKCVAYLLFKIKKLFAAGFFQDKDKTFPVQMIDSFIEIHHIDKAQSDCLKQFIGKITPIDEIKGGKAFYMYLQDRKRIFLCNHIFKVFNITCFRI